MLPLSYYARLVQQNYKVSLSEVANNAVPTTVNLILNSGTPNRTEFYNISTQDLCNYVTKAYFNDYIITSVEMPVISNYSIPKIYAVQINQEVRA